MLRRVGFALLIMLFCAASAWPKWKPEEQEYLNNQFRALQSEVQALKKQNDALAAQLVQMQRNQSALQTALVAEQHKVEDLQQLISSLRIGNEENFAAIKSAMGKLHDEQEKSFSDLIGRITQTAAAPTPAAQEPASPPPPTVKGYVTMVKGDVITLNVGAAQGIHVGSRLQLFKATDLNTPVGEVEVTEVTDSGTSHARVVSLSPGVEVGFSDVVRSEP